MKSKEELAKEYIINKIHNHNSIVEKVAENSFIAGWDARQPELSGCFFMLKWTLRSFEVKMEYSVIEKEVLKFINERIV